MDYGVLLLLAVVAVSILWMESKRGVLKLPGSEKFVSKHNVPVMRGAIVFCPDSVEGARVASIVRNKANPEYGTVILVGSDGESFSLDVCWNKDFYVESVSGDNIKFLAEPERSVRIWCVRDKKGDADLSFGPGHEKWSSLINSEVSRDAANLRSNDMERRLKVLASDKIRTDAVVSKADELKRIEELIYSEKTKPTRNLTKEDVEGEKEE